MTGRKPKTYHVGWYVHRGRKNTAVFQFRRNIDDLNCEIVEYLGAIETTKADARRRLDDYIALVLPQLREAYPKYNLQNVTID